MIYWMLYYSAKWKIHFSSIRHPFSDVILIEGKAPQATQGKATLDSTGQQGMYQWVSPIVALRLSFDVDTSLPLLIEGQYLLGRAEFIDGSARTLLLHTLFLALRTLTSLRWFHDFHHFLHWFLKL